MSAWKAHVLVVDDDPDTRSLVYEILDHEGYLVTLTPGGREAMKELSHNRYDLVITDLRMDDLHGSWVVRHIRNLWPETPVIVMTAHPDDPTLTDALAAGAVGLHVKPFKVDEFLSSVQYALRHRWIGVAAGNEKEKEGESR